MWKNKKFLYGLLIGAILITACGISLGFALDGSGASEDSSYQCNCRSVPYTWYESFDMCVLTYCPDIRPSDMDAATDCVRRHANAIHDCQTQPRTLWVEECDTCYR